MLFRYIGWYSDLWFSHAIGSVLFYFFPVEGIEYLSPDIRLDELWIALEAVLQETANSRHKVNIFSCTTNYSQGS